MGHPRFGEVIRLGAKEGTYLGRKGPVIYSILWKGSKHPEWTPAACIDRTGVINYGLLADLVHRKKSPTESLGNYMETQRKEGEKKQQDVGKHISSRVNTRRRGGLKTGPRKTVGTPGGTVMQGRAGSPDDPRLAHAPVEDEEPKKTVAS